MTQLFTSDPLSHFVKAISDLCPGNPARRIEFGSRAAPASLWQPLPLPPLLASDMKYIADRARATGGVIEACREPGANGRIFWRVLII